MPTFSRFPRYFMEVAHWCSIRRAAEALHVSASAIDRQILKAEQALGVQLFERLPSGLRLTRAGELLLVDVRRWEKSFQRTLEQLDELKGLRRGHVEIAMIDALSEGIVVDRPRCPCRSGFSRDRFLPAPARVCDFERSWSSPRIPSSARE
ncbi:LysR family transcriptional regulator [Xanthomonas translucens pv. undulosa]|nr:LysR family transcriptional regulator [Xanthomonas translucens pv. undulosa]